MGQLAIIENQFKPLIPRMEAAIPANANLPATRIMQSVLIACEKNERLMECTALSLHRSVFTACTLGLPVDGGTGQGYLVPYGKEAQFQTGFKGYSTIAARSRYILGGDVIYEGEHYEVMLGSGGFARVHPDFSIRKPGAKIVAAFATLESNFAPPLVVAMSLDEIMRIMRMSKDSRSDAPWKIHFEQQAIKTAKKRLGKSCPMDILQLAAGVDDAADMGKRSYIRPEDGALLVGEEAQPLTPFQPPPLEPFTLEHEPQAHSSDFILKASDGREFDMVNPEAFSNGVNKALAAITTSAGCEAFQDRHRTILRRLEVKYEDLVIDVRERTNRRLHELKGQGV